MHEDDHADDIAGEPLGYLLKRAAATLRAQTVHTVLEPLGLGFTHYMCMRMLSQSPAKSNAELARHFDVSPQAMNKVVRDLEHRGLVTRPTTPSTGRARPTKLTRDGRVLLKRSDCGVREAERRLMAKLTLQDERNLRRLLLAFGERGQDTPAPLRPSLSGPPRLARRQ
jgi:DNA-binding MarR family transcriptional regulator